MSSVKPRIHKLRAIAVAGNWGSGRLFAGALILVIALVAATMSWGEEAHAATQAAKGFRVLETCAAGANCSPQVDDCNVGVWNSGTQAMGDVRPVVPPQFCDSEAAAQEDDVDSPDIVVWSAMMTVGKSDIASIGYLGFITGDWPDTGSIDDVAFTHGGVGYIVTALYHPIVTGNPNHLFLHLDMPLPDELTLQVGADVFAVSDAEVLGVKHNIYHWYLDEGLGWVDGDQIPVSLAGSLRSGGLDGAFVRSLPTTSG